MMGELEMLFRPPPKLIHASTEAAAFAASRAAMRRLLRSAVTKVRRSISVSQSSCDMVAGFSFDATVRVFGGAFAGALLFGGMARLRGFFGFEAGWEIYHED
jgi:hypothetical protein